MVIDSNFGTPSSKAVTARTENDAGIYILGGAAQKMVPIAAAAIAPAVSC